MLSATLTLFVQLLSSGVLLIAATSKMRDLPGFGATIGGLIPAGPRLTRAFAVLVVTAELATAVLVWVPSAAAGLAAAALLFGVLAVVAFRAGGLPTPVHCRCFGRSDGPLGRLQGWRNAVLAVTAGVAVPLAPSEQAAVWSLPVGAVALAAAAAAVVVLVTVFLNDIADLVRG